MGEQSSESRVVGPLDRGGDGEALEDLHLLDQRQCLLRHAALGDRVRSVLVGQPHHLDDVVVAQAPDRSRFGTFSISGVLRRRTAAAITAVGAAMLRQLHAEPACRSVAAPLLGDGAVAGVALGGGEVGCRVGAAAAAESIRTRPAGEPVGAAAAAEAVVARTAR
jgi:hypothetical protein